MVMEKESWLIIPPETIEVVSFPGLLGDGAALFVSSSTSPKLHLLRLNKSLDADDGSKRTGFESWIQNGNPFLPKLSGGSQECFDHNGSVVVPVESSKHKASLKTVGGPNANGNTSLSDEENEDLLADFIDEDSQLPSRVSQPSHSRNNSSQWSNEEMSVQTGSSLSLLR